MMKWLSIFLKVTLALSVLSLFAGSEISVLLIVSLALATLTADIFAANATGTIMIQDIQKYITSRKQTEMAKCAAIFVFVAMAASMAAYAAPSFCGEQIMIPDVKAGDAFSAKTDYMSAEGYIMYYCKAKYGMDITREEAREMVKGVHNVNKKNEKAHVLKARRHHKNAANACESCPGCENAGKDVRIPDVRNVKAFTGEANFMSLEGYVMAFFRIKEGKIISREDAHRLVKKVMNLE